MSELVEETIGRIRYLTLNRPDALNAFNERLFDLATDALDAAAADPDVSVVAITGTGRAFSAGLDLRDLAARNNGTHVRGRHGPDGFIGALVGFPKPLLIGVNGIAVGLGATMLGLADLVVMADDVRIRYPFTSLGLAPEAGASAALPTLIGRQAAAWALLSSEWLSAAQCGAMGIAFEVVPAADLRDRVLDRAAVIAAQPTVSLVETKRAIVAPMFGAIEMALDSERAAFARLLGGPANRAALTAIEDHAGRTSRSSEADR